MSDSAIGFEQVTVAGTSIGLTAGTFGVANKALITVESAAVRFRLDATAPTAAVGTPLEVGSTLELYGADLLSRVRFIRRDGVSATINCQYLLGDD